MDFIKKGIANVFSYSIGLVIVNGLTFLMLPFYTRQFPPHEYALLALILTILPLTRYCLPLEVCQAAPMFSTDKESRSVLYVSIGFWFTIAVNLAFYSLLCVTNFFFKFFDLSLLNLSAICTLLFVDCLFYYSANILRWQLKPLSYNCITSSAAILESILSIILLLVFKFNVMGVIYAWIIGRGLGFILTLVYTKKFYAFYFNIALLKKMLKFSTPLVIANIPYNINRSLDRWLIATLMGVASVGIYGAGSSIAGIVNFMMASLSTGLSPLIYKNNEKESAPKEILQLFFITALTCAAIAITFALFDKEISPWLISASYYQGFDNQPVVPVFVLSSIVAGIFIFFPGLYIKKKTTHVIWFNVLSLLINAILSFALIFYCGIFGVAIASFMSVLANTVLYGIFSQKYYPLPFNFSHAALLISFIIVYIGALGLGMNLYSFPLRILYGLAALSLLGWLTFRHSIKEIDLESAIEA